MYCYQNTKEEGDGYGYENGYDYLQGFVCIDEVSICKAPALFIVFTIAKANVPPNNANIIDTVVDVGSPIVLNMSSKTTSVSMTANKILMISFM